MNGYEEAWERRRKMKEKKEKKKKKKEGKIIFLEFVIRKLYCLN
jgi:hypothetical protein